MKQNMLQVVCYIAVLSSATFWTGEAAINPKLQKITVPPMPALYPKGTPCYGAKCALGSHCAVNENNKASCVCNGDPLIQICGIYNKTISGYCTLPIDTCSASSSIMVVSEGHCQDVGAICAATTCLVNRECAVVGDQAICVCIQTCPSFIDPVCGSDNQTYMTECDLQRKACLTNEDITVAYTGECIQATVCDGFSCPNGTHCAVNKRRRPVCICLSECPDTTDIVCGSNDRTYGNECELYKDACKSATRIRVAYKGFCLKGSVCKGHTCPADRLCSVDEDNRPFCGCIQNCDYTYHPVCGSDGITYQNLCDFNRLTCRAHVNVTVIRAGQCSYPEYCNNVVCPELLTCQVDANNQTSCACNTQCNDYYFPVCGSDNKTHINYCQMITDACKTNTTITGQYDGVCSEGSNCEGIYCSTGTHCDSVHQPEPTCVCDTVCPDTYSPIVCGSDNKTYNNNCELQREACLTNTSITVQFQRTCAEGPGCDFTNCPYDRICVVDKRNRPRCVCSQSCYPNTYEVCGTDNRTYTNECFLGVAACMTNKTISVQSYGKCQEVNPCEGVVCSSNQYCDLDKKGQPTCVCKEDCRGLGSIVCGSDNKTYVNLCELQRQNCFSDPNLIWVHYGRCAEATVCDGVSCPSDKRCAVDDQKQPHCVCIDKCSSVKYPICGTDGRSYSDQYKLRMEACTTDRNVTLVYGKDQGLTCSGIYCPWYRVCALDKKKQPTCVCDTDCSSFRFTFPVCGTDGKTYIDECHLRMYACMTNSNIDVASGGPCGYGTK